MPTSMEATLNDIASVGYHQPIAWFRNNGDNAEGYIGYLSASLSCPQDGPNHLRVSSLVTQECS